MPAFHVYSGIARTSVIFDLTHRVYKTYIHDLVDFVDGGKSCGQVESTLLGHVILRPYP